MRSDVLMSGKRKRTVIFLKKKIKILMTIKAGDSYKKISIKFGIIVQTISDIKRNGKRIADFMTKFQAEGDGDSRKTMKQACNVKLDTALYIWFVQRRSLNQIVSGEILRTKAMYLGAKLGVDKFSASQRHGIRCLTTQGERLSADQSSAEDFTKNLSQYLKNNEYKPDFVCNADETGLGWKYLPNKTLASRTKRSVGGLNWSKERVTILCCVNASGNDQVPLLLIGKLLKTNRQDWKDNAPCHPNAQDLERKDGKFKAMFLPPNATSLIQPMNQRLIHALKQRYKKELI
ncbi:Jerky -like protein-like [Trichinella pseudospiralis]|uniref:Jerky-like protein-like n=1 Tax=Trichinella pseudospiralis TaxID=6337 RepID=A0A0V1EQH6_TRIPS|nr:Jerky -like protein-like [Trichinella pseudospiralis]